MSPQWIGLTDVPVGMLISHSAPSLPSSFQAICHHDVTKERPPAPPPLLIPLSPVTIRQTGEYVRGISTQVLHVMLVSNT